MIFPLVVLIVAGIMSAALRMEQHIESDAQRHRQEALEHSEGEILSVENILRGVWIVAE